MINYYYQQRPENIIEALVNPKLVHESENDEYYITVLLYFISVSMQV